MKIIDVPVGKVKAAAYNPKVIDQESLDALIHSIETFGFVENLVLNKDYTLIGGHQRLEGAVILGLPTVPCFIIDVDKKTEKKLNLVLNNPHAQGKFDSIKLAKLLSEVESFGDFDELNFSDLQLDIGLDLDVDTDIEELEIDGNADITSDVAGAQPTVVTTTVAQNLRLRRHLRINTRRFNINNVLGQLLMLSEINFL